MSRLTSILDDSGVFEKLFGNPFSCDDTVSVRSRSVSSNATFSPYSSPVRPCFTRASSSVQTSFIIDITYGLKPEGAMPKKVEKDGDFGGTDLLDDEWTISDSDGPASAASDSNNVTNINGGSPTATPTENPAAAKKQPSKPVLNYLGVDVSKYYPYNQKGSVLPAGMVMPPETAAKYYKPSNRPAHLQHLEDTPEDPNYPGELPPSASVKGGLNPVMSKTSDNLPLVDEKKPKHGAKGVMVKGFKDFRDVMLKVMSHQPEPVKINVKAHHDDLLASIGRVGERGYREQTDPNAIPPSNFQTPGDSEMENAAERFFGKSSKGLNPSDNSDREGGPFGNGPIEYPEEGDEAIYPVKEDPDPQNPDENAPKGAIKLGISGAHAYLIDPTPPNEVEKHLSEVTRLPFRPKVAYQDDTIDGAVNRNSVQNLLEEMDAVNAMTGQF